MALVTAGIVVLDCAEPEELAYFYKEFLQGEDTHTAVDLVEIKTADGLRMAFRRDANAVPPSWPRPENSLQVHLDFVVEDLDAAERRVVDLGGRPLETNSAPGPYEERSCSDPAGHTFTLRTAHPTRPKRG